MDEKPSLSLGDFGISTSRGFLPDPDPLTCLPKEWEFLDQFGRELPSLIEGRTILVAAKDLSLPTEKMLERLSQPELNRAMTIYGFAASAFVHSCNVEPIIIRSKISLPLLLLFLKIIHSFVDDIFKHHNPWPHLFVINFRRTFFGHSF